MLTQEQEVYLAKIADAGIKRNAVSAKIAEVIAARTAASEALLPLFDGVKLGDKKSVRAFQAAVSNDPAVAALDAELASLQK